MALSRALSSVEAADVVILLLLTVPAVKLSTIGSRAFSVSVGVSTQTVETAAGSTYGRAPS